MNFTELCDEVKLLTRRPDLTERVESAVKAATLKAHHSDFYYKDIYEQSVEFASELYIQNFQPTDIFPRFRKAKYIRIWQGDETDGYAKSFLQPIQIENALDAYGCIKTDVFYQAGQLLQIRGTCPILRVLFGAYLHPLISPIEAYCSWIADEMPFTIIYEAARVIFKSIGNDREAAEMNTLAAEQYSLLRMSYVDDTPTT